MSLSRKERRKQKKLQSSKSPVGLANAQNSEVLAALDMASRLRDQRNFKAALDLCAQIARIEPNNHNIFFVEGTIHAAADQPKLAAASFERCLPLSGSFTPAVHGLACAKMAQSLYPEAIETLLSTDSGHRPDQTTWKLAGDTACAMRQYSRAAKFYMKAIGNKGIAGAAPYMTLAQTQDHAGQPEEARKTYLRALSAGAPAALVHIHLANLELVNDQHGAALNHIEKAIKADPLAGHAHLFRAQHAPRSADNSNLLHAAHAAREKLEALPQRAPELVPLHHALARLHERADNHAQSFTHLDHANTLQASEQHDEGDDVEQLIDQQLGSAFPASFPSVDGTNDKGKSVAFVFGLPRSGTTLVEQILGAHPLSHPVGELDALGWIKKYLNTSTAPDALKQAIENYVIAASLPPNLGNNGLIVDKSIDTYLHIPLVLGLFPSAKLFWCRRHPLDNALSLYQQCFDTHAQVFSTRFDRMARHFRQHARIMNHWMKALPDRILEVRYEDVVTSTESAARKLVAHAGLDWHPACLDFHKSGEQVRTASLTQVRQPIYKTSMAKWKIYEEQLKPLADDIGNLIDDYEAGMNHG